MEKIILLPLLAAATLPAEQIVWEVTLPFRDAGRIRVADGILLTGNITGRGGTTAFDAATGKLLWRVGGQQRGGPIPGPKVVFTTNHEMGASAPDLKTGKPIWRAPHAVVANYANIAYDGSNVYVVGFAGKLWALNAANGQTRWEHVHQPGERAGACLATPVISDGILVYGGGAPDSITALLWGLDPATGKELWRTPVGCAGGIAISDGIAVLSSGSMEAP
jgi:outer membrane protein assembly factor BamB